MSQTSSLSESDPHYWVPLPFVVSYVERRIPKYGLVLEIGSGINNFERADISIDMVYSPNVPKERMILCDVAQEPLPFPDKKFDFVYCRHVLEDMYNPFLVLREMSRVGKAGYIETPSPLSELCRGIDVQSFPWRGYNHHRFIIWNARGELTFLSKYSVIEYVQLDEPTLVEHLKGQSRYWNTHYLWRDKIRFKHIGDDPDFKMPDDYSKRLSIACEQSIEASDLFYNDIERELSKHVK